MTKSKQKSPKNRRGPLKVISNLLVDIFFPVRCINCNKFGDFICTKCFGKIPQNSFQVCPVCEKAITIDGDVCKTCKKVDSIYLDQLFIISDYKDPLLSSAVHLLKYNFIQDLAIPLGKLSTETLSKFSNFPTPDIIIPVPLHKRRLRWRGFNQSELISKVIATELLPGIEIKTSSEILFRKNNTKPQMKIKDYESRKQNIAGCFEIDKEKGSSLAQKRILLIDDICTTGSTINECAKELKKFHPKSISAVVLARQS